MTATWQVGLLTALVQTASAEEPDVDTVLARCTQTVGALPKGMEEAKRRVVRIETTLGSGSGTFISPDGFVLTAAHVVGQARKVTVVLSDETRLEGAVVRLSAEDDVALLRVPNLASPCLPLENQRVPTGADLYVIGSPGGEALAQSVSRGIVSAYRSSEDGRMFLQTDASINPGNSGGPMITANGTLAAVVSFKATGVGIEGLGFGLAAESVPQALGIAVGDATSPDFPVVIRDDATMAATGASGLSVIEKSPGQPQPVAVKEKWCTHWITGVQDPFSGKQNFKGHEGYLTEGKYFDLFVGDDGIALSWAYVPLNVPASAIGPGGVVGTVRMTMALADGTLITLTSFESSLTGPYAGTLRHVFPLDGAALLALASSPWTYARIDFGAGATLDQKVDFLGEDFAKYASCIAQGLFR